MISRQFHEEDAPPGLRVEHIYVGRNNAHVVGLSVLCQFVVFFLHTFLPALFEADSLHRCIQ